MAYSSWKYIFVHDFGYLSGCRLPQVTASGVHAYGSGRGVDSSSFGNSPALSGAAVLARRSISCCFPDFTYTKLRSPSGYSSFATHAALLQRPTMRVFRKCPAVESSLVFRSRVTRSRAAKCWISEKYRHHDVVSIASSSCIASPRCRRSAMRAVCRRAREVGECAAT